MLTATSLTYTYPDSDSPALRDVSFTVEPGQMLLIAGATGSGKSTLCYALAGFVPHYFQGELVGDVALDGQSMREGVLGEWVRSVGLVLQNPFNQISGARATVFEEVAFGLENLAIPRTEMARRVETALTTLAISELRERSPYALSGGQQQRVAIAAVLAMQPRVLVLDEPTAQLDPEGTQEVFAVLGRLAAQGVTVVVATHQLTEVAPFLTHVAVLEKGVLVAWGAADELLRDRRLAGWGVEPPLYVPLAGMVNLPPPLPVTFDEATRQFRQPPRLPPPVTPSHYPFSLSPAAGTVAPVTPLAVQAENLYFSYPNGVTALNNVSVSFAAGQITALIGSNGAGKSTLSRCLNGLLRPQSGTIRVGEWAVKDYPTSTLAQWVGYLFQNPDDQLFKATVAQEVAFGPQNLGWDGTAIEAAVQTSLALTGLSGYAGMHPYDLHPTERRWVALASVLAMRAPVLILDEPVSGFDLRDKSRMAGLCLALRQAGYTLIVVTHDLQLAAELADAVVLLHEGQVVAQGPAATILGDGILMSQVESILPPVARLAQALGLPVGTVQVRDFLEKLR